MRSLVQPPQLRKETDCIGIVMAAAMDLAAENAAWIPHALAEDRLGRHCDVPPPEPSGLLAGSAGARLAGLRRRSRLRGNRRSTA
jgi:hypothetical protein